MFFSPLFLALSLSLSRPDYVYIYIYIWRRGARTTSSDNSTAKYVAALLLLIQTVLPQLSVQKYIFKYRNPVFWTHYQETILIVIVALNVCLPYPN